MPPKKPSPKPTDTRTGPIEAITAPLGFFVLSLLIVETYLATVLVGAQLPESDKMSAVWLGAGLFVLVFAGVFALVWFRPEHVVFTKTEHAERLREALGADSPSPQVGARKPKKRSPARKPSQPRPPRSPAEAAPVEPGPKKPKRGRAKNPDPPPPGAAS